MPTINLDSASGYVVTQAVQGGGSDTLISNNAPDGSISYRLPAVLTNPGFYALSSITGLTVDAQGRIIGFGLGDKLYTATLDMTATSVGQTFTWSHVPGQILVHLNGILLSTTDYTEGTAVGGVSPNVTIPSVVVGDQVTIIRFSETNGDGTMTYTPFTIINIPVVAGQTDYSVVFNQGSEILFYDGVFMSDEDYAYPTANKISLAFTPITTGSSMSLVTFRTLTAGGIPFNQAIGSSTSGSTQVALAGTVFPTSSILYKSGVLLSYTADYTYDSNKNVVLTQAETFSGNTFESTSFIVSTVLSAQGAAESGLETAAASAAESDGNMVSPEGQEFLNKAGATLVSLGSPDPSADNNFDVITLPQSPINKITTLEGQVALLQSQLAALLQQNTGTP